MTQKRQTTLKYTLLTATVGLIIICWLAMAAACGPAAPAGQTATSTDATLNTPTPENTPTDIPSPEPSLTPTPPVTPNMAKLGMYTEAVVSFSPRQPPTPLLRAPPSAAHPARPEPLVRQLWLSRPLPCHR